MKVLKTFGLPLLAALLIAALLAACSPRSAAPAQPDTGEQRTAVIGLSLPNESEAFYAAMKAGAEGYVLRNGGRLVSRNAGNDAALQASDIQALLVSGIDVLLVAPLDSDQIAVAVQAANRTNVPVITLERTVAGGKVLAHVGSDNTAGGRMAARFLAQVLDGRGLVVEIQGLAGASVTRERSNGFTQMLEAYPALQLLAQESAQFNREQARQVFARLLAQHPRIDAVFAHNDEMLIGAQSAAEQAGRAGEIIFIGFDGAPAVVTGIESGLYRATIAQQPEEMGRMSAEIALKYLRGENPPTAWLVELALLSR